MLSFLGDFRGGDDEVGVSLGLGEPLPFSSSDAGAVLAMSEEAPLCGTVETLFSEPACPLLSLDLSSYDLRTRFSSL